MKLVRANDETAMTERVGRVGHRVSSQSQNNATSAAHVQNVAAATGRNKKCTHTLNSRPPLIK